jgi:hypothetical protein
MPVLTRQRLVRRAARSASAAAARAAAVAACCPPLDPCDVPSADATDPAVERARTSADPGWDAGRPGNAETAH